MGIYEISGGGRNGRLLQNRIGKTFTMAYGAWLAEEAGMDVWCNCPSNPRTGEPEHILIWVKVIVWNVQNMLRLPGSGIAGAVAPYVHASLLRQPGAICHCESLAYPVLQQSAIPPASADLVDAHVDKRECRQIMSSSLNSLRL